VIELKNLTKVYSQGNEGLKDVSFEIKKGEFVFIVGASGAGKSTLMKILLQEEKPTTGRIFLNGKDITGLKRRLVPKLRRSIGVVFQDFRLLQDRTVYENVAFAMQVVGASQREIRRQVPFMLSLVGLSQRASHYPHQLSGGEQQRVCIARALVNNPSILIADEPTGNLDPTTAWEIMDLLKDINTRGTTILMATHAKDIVNVMKKRVINLHQGKIIRDEERGGYDDVV
jgi:cell division transport system ATP-binding protein